jgi:hypothetical protein
VTDTIRYGSLVKLAGRQGYTLTWGRDMIPSAPLSWLFPPQSREVQLDEKWSFVGKKPTHCDSLDPADDQKGDWWDHVAYDPAQIGWSWPSSQGRGRWRMPRRSRPRWGNAFGDQAPELIPTDEASAYEAAIEDIFSVPVPPAPKRGAGRPRLVPEPADWSSIPPRSAEPSRWAAAVCVSRQLMSTHCVRY